jgi:hypothetical protein
MPRPKLPPPTIGDVDDFLLACVGRARGSKVSWAEPYTRYRRWRADRQCEPVSAAEFGRQLDAPAARVYFARGGKAMTCFA